MLEAEPVHRAPLALSAAKAVSQTTAFSVLGEALAKSLASRGNLAVARELIDAGIPSGTVSLAHVEEWTLSTLIDEAMRGSSKPPIPYVVGLLQRLSRVQHALGHPHDALATSEMALQQCRAVMSEQGDAFLPNLAGALWGVAVRQAQLRQENAMQTAQEALECYERLASSQPDFVVPLGRMLVTLCSIQTDLGCFDEADTTIKRALELFSGIREKNGQEVLLEIARALRALGKVQRALGKHADALKHAKEDVAICRRLVDLDPEALPEDLAMALHALGITLSELGNFQEAASAIGEAALAYAKLAAKQPDHFLPTFVSITENRAVVLARSRRLEESLAVASQVVAVRRRLSRAHPDAFLLPLAESLRQQGVALYLAAHQK